MSHSSPTTQKIFFALGTVCTLTLYTGNTEKAARRCKDRIMEIHNRMNAYAPDSEVSRINAMAGKEYVTVSPDTLRLIEDSVGYSNLTHGYFDITTHPVSALWKESIATKVLPLPYEIVRAAALTGYRDILIDHDNSAVMLRRPSQQLDLGAIAKGYAADEVRRILAEEDVAEAVVNLGGTIVNIGQLRRIGFQNPFEKTGVFFASVSVGNQCVVTSGRYEQGFYLDGRCYHHIIDPFTGYPSETALAGVSLIGDSAEQLDALSTAAIIMGTEQILPLLQSKSIDAVFITQNGEIYTTNNLIHRYDYAG